MKKKTKEEFRGKSIDEIIKEIKTREAEILRVKMEIKTGKAKNTRLQSKLLDELAVIKTILNEKKLNKEK